MPKDLSEIIHYFETHNNHVSRTELIENLEFPEYKLEKSNAHKLKHFIQLEDGRYALSPKLHKSYNIILPHVNLRLDKQTFEFNSNISRSEAESVIKSNIYTRTKHSNLLVKKINFFDNSYAIEFIPARYSALDNHVVFDPISKSSIDLIKQAKNWEARGQWELGHYFRKMAVFTPQDYPQYVNEVLSSIRQKNGNIGRIAQLSESHHSIIPLSKKSESSFNFDNKTQTYIFGKTYHQAPEETYKSLFSDAFTKFGLHTKRFVSMTFKKILPVVGLVVSMDKIAKADDKLDVAMEEATTITGSIQGSLIAALLAVPTGPIGMAVSGFAGGFIGSELTAGYHAIRRKLTGTNEQKNESISNDSSIPQNQQGIKNNMFSSFKSDEQQNEAEEKLKIRYKEGKERKEKRRDTISDEVTAALIRMQSSSTQSSVNTTSNQVSRTSTKRQKSHPPRTTPREIKDKSTRTIPTQEDKQIADFLIAWGTTPSDIVKLYQKESDWDIAKRAVAKFNELELKMQQQRNQEIYLEFFNGASSVCTALSQSSNRDLVRVGTVALPVISIMANSERLWGVFSGASGSLVAKGFWSSSGAIGGLLAAGIGLLNTFMRSDTSQQRALMRGLQEIHQQIITFRYEVHERFDRVESALRGIAGAMQSYCGQILRNQQTLFEQQKKHIELSLRGFSVMTSMLSDMRIENQQFHTRIFRELSYLTGLQEIASF